MEVDDVELPKTELNFITILSPPLLPFPNEREEEELLKSPFPPPLPAEPLPSLAELVVPPQPAELL